MSECIFCKDLPKVIENEFAYIISDIKPISQGHMLCVVKRHIVQIFEASKEEYQAMFELMNAAKLLLDKQYKPDGYNIQINCGAVAGQIVAHAHMHLIPRYKGLS